MHGVFLGVLLELCDNPKALPHVRAWRGPGGLSSPQLLLQLWRQEEEELGVQRDQHGRITGEQHRYTPERDPDSPHHLEIIM